MDSNRFYCRCQWPRGLRRRSTATRPLRLWVGIPLGAWKFVCCECCVLSGRGLCDGLITRPEKSYRLWRVVVCDQETSNEEAKARYGAVENTATKGCDAKKQTNKSILLKMYRYYAVLIFHNFNMLKRLSEGHVNKGTSRQRFHPYGAPITVAPPLHLHKWNK